jgi:hypothetical protein
MWPIELYPNSFLSGLFLTMPILFMSFHKNGKSPFLLYNYSKRCPISLSLVHIAIAYKELCGLLIRELEGDLYW